MTPDRIVKAEYGCSKNFITPNVIRYGWIRDQTMAYELSSGSGMETGSTIWGVSIVEMTDWGPRRRTDISRGGFRSCQQAESYIKELKVREENRDGE